MWARRGGRIWCLQKKKRRKESSSVSRSLGASLKVGSAGRTTAEEEMVSSASCSL